MAEVGQLRRCSWGSRLGALFIAALTGVTVRAANPSDEVGEYYLDAEGVKHYYVFWDKSTSSYNYNFSWTRQDAAASGNTYGVWKSDFNGPIWTFGAGVEWPGARYIGNFAVYGFHIEGATRKSFRFEQESAAATMTIGGYGIRSDINNFSFKTYSATRTVHLAMSQTWAGPDAAALSSSPFYIVPGANNLSAYTAQMSAADDVVLTLQGDLVYSVIDYGTLNDLSNADIVIKEPAILSLVGFWKNDGWRNSALKARSITIDGGAGLYFGKRTANASGAEIVLGEYPLNGDSRGRYGMLGSAPVLTPDVAGTIVLKNGATLTAETETTVSGGVRIVVPAGETAKMKGRFRFGDTLTVIELGEGAYLDLSEATILDFGKQTVVGKGTFGPESLRYGSDATGDYYIDNAMKKRYVLYQNRIAETRWSMNGNSYTREGARAGTGAVNWQPNAIFALEGETAYAGSYSFGGVQEVCGFLFEAPVDVRIEGGQTFNLGSYGIRSTTSDKTVNFYSKNANPVLTSDQTWMGPDAAELSARPFFVNIPYTYQDSYRGAVAASDDVVWTLAGDMVVSLKTYTNDLSNADVVIRKPAVLSLPSGTFGTGRLKARTLTIDGGAGVYFGRNKSVTNPGAGSGGYGDYGIGSFAALSPDQVARTVILKDGATLTARETTTVSGGVTIRVTGTEAAAFAGDFVFADDMTRIVVDAGATLDLTGATLSRGRIELAGEGEVILNLATITAPFALDPRLTVEYVLSSEGRFFVSKENLQRLAGNVLVTSGTMVIEDVASIPAGCTISTVGDAALLLLDPTGFDAETMMGGTKNLAVEDRLMVTDVPRSGVTEVGAGETIEIWGNGLGSAAKLRASDGATVLFVRSAEIAADLETQNSVRFKVDDAAVTGTVSGAWMSLEKTSQANETIEMYGPGALRFTGGAELRGSTFWMRSQSRVEISQNRFDAYVSLCFRDGHLTIRDGGVWRQRKEWINLTMNQYLEGSGKAVLEIGEGGAYYRGNNTQTIIGQDDDSPARTARLFINGGLFETAYPDEFSLNGNGILEIANGGYLSNECMIGGVGRHTRRVILGDGIWGNEMTYAGMKKAMFKSGESLEVEVTGNMLFDLSGAVGDAVTITNVAEGAASWTFREGSTIRLRGRSDRRSTLWLRDVAVEPGTRVDLGSTNPVADVKFDCGGVDRALTWVVPPMGADVGKVIGDGGALTASYVVPRGGAFVAEDFNGWHEGFGDVTVEDLAFEAGSTFVFPFFGTANPLAINGVLTLCDGMNAYQVIRKGAGHAVTDVPVLTAGRGVVGSCSWTCTRGVRDEVATLASKGDSLVFSYAPRGAVVIIR